MRPLRSRTTLVSCAHHKSAVATYVVAYSSMHLGGRWILVSGHVDAPRRAWVTYSCGVRLGATATGLTGQREGVSIRSGIERWR